MAKITFSEWVNAIGLTAEDYEEKDEMKGRLQAKYDEAMKAMEEGEEEEDEDEAKAQDEEEEEEKPAKAGEVPPQFKKKDEEEEEVDARQKFDLDVIRAGFDDGLDDLELLYAKYEDEDNLDKKVFRTIKAAAKADARVLKTKAISGKWLGDLFGAKFKAIHAATELKLVQSVRPKGPTIMTKRSGDPDMSMDILGAAVMSAGKYQKTELTYALDGTPRSKIVERVDDVYTDQVLQAAHDKFRQGIGLQELIMSAAEMNGWDGRSFKQEPQTCLRYAFGEHPAIHASGTSTADISGLLSNIANKFLLQGFFFVEQAWREISDVQPVNDFKTRTSYRLTGAEEFKLVPPSGEIPHGTLTEESYTNRADTRGLMLNVTRTNIINDDLGAITTVPKKLGRGAGLALNKVFWTEFLGQLSTTFTGARANYFSGAATTLQVSSLTTAEQMFMDLTDADGNPIGHMPVICLVPTALSAVSAQLFRDTELRNTTASTEYTTGNPHAGKFRPVVSRYIANTAYTGYTSTGWGIFADPQDIPTIEICFLYGNESPTVDQADADFNTLGIQMRGYLDFGVNTQDYRGGVWSKGAA